MEKIGFIESRQRNFEMYFYHSRKKPDKRFSNSSNAYKLPKIKGVRSSFTDDFSRRYFIFWPQPKIHTIYYDDGEVLGSLLGEST
jgi:hypothetical protein